MDSFRPLVKRMDKSNEDKEGKGLMLAKYMKALGHPTRLAIVKTLLDKSRCPHGCHPCTCGENCPGANCKCGCKCGELAEQFPGSQSTISQHIKELKNAGIIDLSGRKGDYTLNHSKLTEGLISLLDLLGYNSELIMEEKKCNCGDNCTCGDDCQCGEDCQCKNGGECTCGNDCQCEEESKESDNCCCCK